MLGTDYPFPLGELEPGALIESMHEFDSTLKVPVLYRMYLNHPMLQIQNFRFDYASSTLTQNCIFLLICRINFWLEMLLNFWVLKGNSLSDMLRIQLLVS